MCRYVRLCDDITRVGVDDARWHDSNNTLPANMDIGKLILIL